MIGLWRRMEEEGDRVVEEQSGRSNRKTHTHPNRQVCILSEINIF